MGWRSQVFGGVSVRISCGYVRVWVGGRESGCVSVCECLGECVQIDSFFSLFFFFFDFAS